MIRPVRAADRSAAREVIRDAILLPLGLLIATVERGVCLLERDGTEKGRWDIRASNLTVSDDGATAVLVEPREKAIELHRLDLHTHQLTRLTSLASYAIAGTFDGSSVIADCRDGLKRIDLTSDPPKRVWSAFSRRSTIEEFHRTPTRLSAIVLRRRFRPWRSYKVERWTWELPSHRLIDRRADARTWGYMFTVAAPLKTTATTADGTLLHIEPAGQDEFVEFVSPIGADRTERRLSGQAEIAVDGNHSALVQWTARDTKVTLRETERQAPVAVVTFPQARFAHLRAHGDSSTTYTADGRIVALDLRTGELLASISVT